MENNGRKYKVIYADPPWEYRNKNTGRSEHHTIKNFNIGMISGASNKYSCMSVDELCDININMISQNDCVLFLWATTPLLPDAFRVMKTWGFEYKTAIYWRKVMSLGMGFWFRGQVELCLVGIKGKIKAFRCQKPNFIQSKARKHSQKPDQMYGIIEGLELEPKIELFARQRREGWDCYGNELSKTIQKRLS